MIDINKQIEDTRDKLNMLIATKTIITGDKELLTLSVRQDNLINQYIHTKNSDVKSSSNYRATMMEMTGSGAQSNDNYNKMIEIMKENGFVDEANAMENKDFDTMKKLMTNISDDDYKKMIDVMKNKGYEPMANMMQSVGRDNMVKFHQSMMRR